MKTRKRTHKTIPVKSERIDILKLRNHLDSLNLSNADNLNFWLYCRIALGTGLRSIDIIEMKVSSINFSKRIARIVIKKTKRTDGSKKDIVIPADVLSKIDKDQEYVLWNKKYDTKVSLMTINRRLKKVFKDDDIAVSSHSIRKAVGRYIYDVRNKDLPSVMAILGHKNPNTTIKYLEIDKDEMNEIYELLDLQSDVISKHIEAPKEDGSISGRHSKEDEDKLKKFLSKNEMA